MLWDPTYYDGTPTTNRVYYQKSLTAMVQQPSDPTQPPSWWAVTSANGINDNGAIIGLASYTQIPYAPVQHGVLLLPCQFRLLNGDQNSADYDGMDFFGNRPTTISATSNYNSEYVADIGTNNLSANDGLDVLGIDLPLGSGRGDAPDIAYANSLLMTAKVLPASANVTYGWGRFYLDRSVTIRHLTSPTNYWYVQSANNTNNPTGLPNNPEWDTDSSDYYTLTPNSNIICFYDDPAMNLTYFEACSTNDYAYEKCDYFYYLTNSIGSTNAIATVAIGNKILAQRKQTTGYIPTDWITNSNIISATNILDCSGVTTNEIRAIVGGSIPIVIDSGVTNDYYVHYP